jgi:hypothetical protein
MSLLTGYLLCKSCGADTTILNLIINDRISEQATVSNFTIGEKKLIVVQELTNPLGIKFKVFITKQAHCAKNPNSAWFPGE